ncbi:MAG: hypothetical protein PHV68_02065 [Candidatus Gastranaerophilales bacterium]|nr:hypothetical protein [Candidatus Gastranaerophilales bacterium]
MKCPQCGEVIKSNLEVCPHCKTRVRVVCPKCKTLNKTGREICSNCKFKLINNCPQCKAPNLFIAKVCTKCNYQLIKKCEKCGAFYSTLTEDCPRCKRQKEDLDKNIEEGKETFDFLNKFVSVTIELINVPSLKKRIDDEKLTEKLIKKFYQTIAKQGKICGEKARKISEQEIVLDFANQNSFEHSVNTAINAAKDILADITDFNFSIKDSLHMSLKIKIGISTASYKEKNDFAQKERSLAKAGDIIVNQDIYCCSKTAFSYESIGSITVDDKKIQLYKFIDNPVKKLEMIKDEEAVSSKNEAIENSSQQNVPKTQKIIEKKYVEPEPKEDYASRNEIFAQVVNFITKDNGGNLIGICAPDGYGKTTFLSIIYQHLKSEASLWIRSQASPLNKHTPFSLFQDMFKSMLDMPALNLNLDDAKDSIGKIFETAYEINDKQFVKDICKIAFCKPDNDLKDIYLNREKSFKTIYNFLAGLSSKTKIVLLAEDVEFADSASLECLKYLIDNGILEKINIIMTYSKKKPINDVIESIVLNENNSKTFALNPLKRKEMDDVLMSFMNNKDIIDENFKKELFAKAKGNPLYIAETIHFLMQTGIISTNGDKIKISSQIKSINLPDKIEELIKARLHNFGHVSDNIIKLLVCASLIGTKFIPMFLNKILKLPDEEYKKILQILAMNGIIVSLNNYNCAFRHYKIWEVVHSQGLLKEQRAAIYAQLYKILKEITLNESSKLAVYAEVAKLKQQAVKQWEKTAKEAYSLGDIAVYTMAQKRILMLLDRKDLPDKELFLTEIYEKIGMANYTYNPAEAVNMLSNAVILNEKHQDIQKTIRLSGYLAKSCELLGNYTGSLECSEKAMSLIDNNKMPFEKILLNYSKLVPLFNLGCLEQVINIAQTDIIPDLINFIEKEDYSDKISKDEALYILLDSELYLAKALAYQGNYRVIEVLKSINEKAKKFQQPKFVIEAQIITAFYKAVQGLTLEAAEILNNLKINVPNIKNSLNWNFVNFIIQLISQNAETIINDGVKSIELSKVEKAYIEQSILKAFIALLYQQNGDPQTAKEMYYDLIKTSSENKLATTSLLVWTLLASWSLEHSNADEALQIAESALEVALKPNINNHLFVILLKKALAEIYIVKNDFEMARINVEQALKLAGQMNLHLIECKLHQIHGRLLQEKATAQESGRRTSAEKSRQFYLQAMDLAKKLDNKTLIESIEKDLGNLGTFCQLSGIEMR